MTAAPKSPVNQLSLAQSKERITALRKVAPPTESQEQAAFVTWFRANWRELGCRSPLVLIASQAGAMLGGGNDGLRFARFAKLKREGFTRGVPDLFIAAPREPYHGLWLEMKRTKGGTVSPEQQEMHRVLRTEGYFVAVAKGADEAKAFAESYLCCKLLPAYDLSKYLNNLLAKSPPQGKILEP